MADYLLAAHINVTGGAEAAAQFSQMAIQINNFGTAAKTASTGGLNQSLKEGVEHASKFSDVLGRVGDAVIRMATYKGIAMVIQGFKDAADAVLDFDQQMTESLAIQSGVSDTMRGKMEDLAKTISVDLGLAPAEVAEGFYHLASAGLTVDQQLADLPVVANFAKAGMMDLDAATEMLFDSLTALGLKVKDPAQQMQNLVLVSDLLTRAAIRSQGTVQDFGSALANKAGADIKSYGIDLQEGVALLEVFADRGIKGAKAGTAFDMVIRDMAIKATKNADAFKKFGIEVFDSEGNFNSLITIFEQLDAALLKMPIEQRTVALAEMGYTLKSGQLIQGLLGTSGALKAFTIDLEGAGGAAQDVAEKQMESLRSKLAQLKSVSLVFAIEGFEKLEEAAAWLVDTFSPAMSAVVEVMGDLAAGAAPVAAAFGGLVAGAVVAGLQGIASAIETVFSVMAEHEGTVRVLGAALAALGAGAVLSSIYSIGAGLAETIGLKALYAADGIRALVATIRTMSAAEGAMSVVKAGLSGIVSILASPVVIGAGLILALVGVIQAFESGKDKAREFAQQLEKKYDIKTLQGVTDAATDAAAHLEEVKAASRALDDGGIGEIAFNTLGTILDTITPKFFSFNGNTIRMRGELAGTREEAERFKAAQMNISTGFTAIDQSFKGVAGNAFVLDPMTQQLMGIAREAQAAGIHVDTSAGAMARLAAANNIDLSAPWETWAPILAQSAADLGRVRGEAEQMGGVAAGVGTEMSTMEEAMATLGDEAANAEQKLSALKTVMDGLSGGQQNLFDMTTNYQEALAGLSASFVDTAVTFDSATEAGRKQRDALSDAATAARDLALAHAESSGNMAAGAAELTTYAAGIENVLRSAGVAEPQIAALLFQMGLTPAQIDTLFKLTVDPPAPVVAAEIDTATGPRDVPITPAVDQGAKAVAEGEMTQTTRPRPSTIGPYVEPSLQSIAEGILTNTARSRPSEAQQFPTGYPFVADMFEWSTQKRDSQANQFGTGWPTVASMFNDSARHRESTATQSDPTSSWSAVNTLFNYAARNRTAAVDITTTYTTINVPGPGGAANIAAAAEGGVIKAYAYGGHESHLAQIAHKGPRLWAEPETGGEAYIPLAMSKRARSLAIWEETGKMLGASQRSVTMSAPISVTVNGATDPEATGRAIAGQVAAGVNSALHRVLVELRST